MKLFTLNNNLNNEALIIKFVYIYHLTAEETTKLKNNPPTSFFSLRVEIGFLFLKV